MQLNKINFIALAAGISTLILVAVSIFFPWWTFTAGTGGNPADVKVNFSPVNFNLVVNGASVAIPLVLALNIACLLTLLAGGIVLTIYSVKPVQPYSKQLLGFGYKKPLYILVIFIAELIAIPLAIKAFGGLSFPLGGAATLQLPQNWSSSGSSQIISVSTALGWPFYFAILATALSIAARFYHRKITVPEAVPPAT